MLEAIKYEYKIDWYEQGRNSYLAAIRLEQLHPGLYKECLSKMKAIKDRPIPVNFKWTKELVREACLEIPNNENLMYLKLNYAGCYPMLNKLKKQDMDFYYECTDHLIIQGKICSINTLKTIVKSYTYKSDWEKDSSASYDLVRKTIKKNRPKLYKELVSHFITKKHGKISIEVLP